MKIAIGTDHNGELCKKKIINALKNIEFIDCSPKNNPLDDYPDFAFKVAELVKEKKVDYGILLCGSGIGMSIAANKVKGIRCALVHSQLEAKLARLDNDANILSISSKYDIDRIIKIINVFISTDHLPTERHDRRIKKIINYEDGAYNEL